MPPRTCPQVSPRCPRHRLLSGAPMSLPPLTPPGLSLSLLKPTRHPFRCGVALDPDPSCPLQSPWPDGWPLGHRWLETPSLLPGLGQDKPKPAWSRQPGETA